MRNRGCEDVGLCLQVLGHESSVGCNQTAYLFIIDKRKFFAELLGAFDDIVGCAFTPCVDVACRELLSVTDSSARIDDIYYIVS